MFELFQILQSRPVTVAAEEDEGRTDWHNSELISECLCWHNVYRQRHGSPDLTMCPQVRRVRLKSASRLLLCMYNFSILLEGAPYKKKKKNAYGITSL